MNKGLIESGDAIPTPHKYYRLCTRDTRARR